MAPTLTLPIDRRREIVETQENITLNGFPARIAGWKNDFATIHELHPGTISAEFSWLTVEHIIDTKGGAFRA